MTRVDVAYSGAGFGAAIWNFFVSGQFNMLLAAVAGVITIVILLQRYRINRRVLDGPKDDESV